MTKTGLALLIVLGLLSMLGERLILLQEGPSHLEGFRAGAERKTPLVLGAMVGGFRRVTADLLWMDLIQYYGGRENAREGYRQFYPKLLNITSLDPHFVHAYTYGAAILVWNLSREPEGVALMQEGLTNNPTGPGARTLGLCLAGLTLQRGRELDRLVPLIERLVQYPGHPFILERMLGFIYEKQGQKEKARSYWQWVADHTLDNWVRDTARQRLGRLPVHPGR